MRAGCKFEVGKTYKCTTGTVAKCLFAYEVDGYNLMIGERPCGRKGQFSGESWSEHEYREPRTVKGYVSVWDTPKGVSFGSIYDTYGAAAQATAGNWKHLGVLEISWVEKV